MRRRLLFSMLLVFFLAALSFARASARPAPDALSARTITFSGNVYRTGGTFGLTGATVKLYVREGFGLPWIEVDASTSGAGGSWSLADEHIAGATYRIIETNLEGWSSTGATAGQYGHVVDDDTIEFPSSVTSGTYGGNVFYDNPPPASATPTPTHTRPQPTSTATPWLTATREQQPTATIKPTRTATPSRTKTRIPITEPTDIYLVTATPSPTPSTDLYVHKIEITQGVQNMWNHVRLVDGKRTFVRVHCRSTSGVHATYAQLLVSHSSGQVLLAPVNAGTVWTMTNPDRGTVNHAFLFELPSYFTHGNVVMTARLNPVTGWRDRDPQETNYGNNEFTAFAHFEHVPALPIVMYRVSYTLDNTFFRAPHSEVNNLVNYLHRIYPVSGILIWLRTAHMGEATLDEESGWLISPTCGDVNGTLLIKTLFDAEYGGSIPANARIYGMVDDRGGVMRGCALSVPARVASGPTGDADWGWDLDGSYGDWYGAHELGHVYGRGHANYCDATGGPPYPYTDGRISLALSENWALYGFDVGTRDIYPPTSKDLMSYCDNLWVSDFTYEGLMDYIQAHVSSANVAANGLGLVTGDAVDRLLVAGSIDPSTHDISLGTLMVLPDATIAKEPVPGDYAIVLLDAAEAELARYPFKPIEQALGPVPPVPGLSAMQESELLGFYELVAFVEGTARVDIEGPERTLASVSAGLTPPSVTILSPNGGETLDGDAITVAWMADDADGDPLTFAVQFSADNGATWELVASEITDTLVALDAVNVSGTEEGLFRVWVSDGINTTYDVSDAPFAVPNRAPEVSISAPSAGATAVLSQTVAFIGAAYDPDTGSMDDAALTWTSDVDGLLGQGAQLSVASLSAGPHTVTLAADDGLGGMDNATVHITVVVDPSEMVYPDQLVAEPGIVTLRPDQGVASVALSISNRNAGSSIPWQATAAQDWLALSATEGQTDAIIQVSYVDQGLVDGVYLGAIHLAGPPGPQAGETVYVELHLGQETSAFLPIVMMP